MVRVMCNKSVPMVNAHVILVVNRTSKGPLAIDVGVTADKGDYIGPAFLGADTRFSEVRNMILVFTNACGATVGPCTNAGSSPKLKNPSVSIIFVRTFCRHKFLLILSYATRLNRQDLVRVGRIELRGYRGGLGGSTGLLNVGMKI